MTKRFPVILVFFFILLPASASPLIGKSVWIDEVSGLAAYFEEEFRGSAINRETTKILVADLDEVPDGVDEVLLAVRDFQSTCGNRGCEHRLLKRQADGTWKNILHVLTFNVVIAEGYTNGMRNLADAEDGDRSFIVFDGKGYDFGEPAAAGGATKAAAIGPSEFNGKCFKGERWAGHGDPDGTRYGNGPGGKAAYGGCGDGESSFYLSCEPGKSTVRMYVEFPLNNGLPDGTKVGMQASVDGKIFVVSSMLSYSEMLSGNQPIADMQKSDPFLAALKSGRRGKFLITKGGVPFHLKGSSKALDAMLSGCR